MIEIVHCLPSHVRPHFLRVKQQKMEMARAEYDQALGNLRDEAAARGTLRSGMQLLAEWQIRETFLGQLARAHFEAAIETCTLYEIPLDVRLCKCVEDGVRDLLVAQYRNALTPEPISNVKVPLHLRGQIASDASHGRLPIFNAILIELEKARIESLKVLRQKQMQTQPTQQASIPQTGKPMLKTASIIHILIASPGDVTEERDVVTACTHEWNAAHSRSTGIMLHPVRWETHAIPASGDRPQALINRQIVDEGDCLIGIFGVRLGTPTGEALSGTIEEIERFRNAGKHVSLYFSKAAVPRDADRTQLAALEAYQRDRRKDTLFFEFATAGELHRLVSQHLPGIVTIVTKALEPQVEKTVDSIGAVQYPRDSRPNKESTQESVSETASDGTDAARVFIRSRPGPRSGDVKTVQISAVIENLSEVRKIRDYVCTLSVPKACLTHTSAIILGEIRKADQPNRRFFRRSNDDPGAVSVILQGDKVVIFALDLGIDQLRMSGTYLAGDYEGTLRDKVTLDVVVDGKLLHAERTVADIFENPNLN